MDGFSDDLGFGFEVQLPITEKGQYAASVALQIRIRRPLQTIRSLILLLKILSLKILKEPVPADDQFALNPYFSKVV